MPIEGIEQPEILNVSRAFRLLKYNGQCDFALSWYKDPRTLRMMGLPELPFDILRLKALYNYLNAIGELYIIEFYDFYEKCRYPIGDVALCLDDISILIGPAGFRKQHIATQVMRTLMDRAKRLGIPQLEIREIAPHNTAAMKLINRLGFIPCEDSESGGSYKVMLLKEVDILYNDAVKLLAEGSSEEDKSSAYELLTRGHKMNHRLSTFKLGECYQFGYGTEINLKKAFELYLDAAYGGYDPAMLRVGYFYNRGIHNRRNSRLASVWLYRAVASGNPDIYDDAKEECLKMLRINQELNWNFRR